jgi:hypothetical protein
MRLLAVDAIGMTQRKIIQLVADLEQLCALQRADGSWDDGPLYKYGSWALSIDSRGLTTTLADAIRAHRRENPALRVNTHLFIVFSIACLVYCIFFSFFFDFLIFLSIFYFGDQ